MASWSVSKLQLMPARVRKLLSSVLPTPPATRSTNLVIMHYKQCVAGTVSALLCLPTEQMYTHWLKEESARHSSSACTYRHACLINDWGSPVGYCRTLHGFTCATCG